MPHGNDAVRWFVYGSSKQCQSTCPKCPVLMSKFNEGKETSDFVSCPLALIEWAKSNNLCEPHLPDAQRTKLVNRHAQYANRLIRCINRMKIEPSQKLLSEDEIKMSEKIQEEFGEKPSLAELEASDKLLSILHS